jgi:CheY-like chemotaxis protein
MAALFEPFVRGQSARGSGESRAGATLPVRPYPDAREGPTQGSTPSPTPGLGLGLAIARRCASLLGGTLTAANRPARGAAFTLEIPRRFDRAPSAEAAGVEGSDAAPVAPAIPPRPAHAAASASAPAASPASPRRILVVDDAPDARRLLLHHLRALGQHPAAAASLAEAHALLAARTFDLVIVDRRLGDGDGASLAMHPAVLAHRTPLALSSADPEASPAVANAAVLPKPIDRRGVERLLAALGPAPTPPAPTAHG